MERITQAVPEARSFRRTVLMLGRLFSEVPAPVTFGNFAATQPIQSRPQAPRGISKNIVNSLRRDLRPANMPTTSQG